jgi:hypothetical protein
MSDVDLVMAQAPASCTKETVEEALMQCAGDHVEAIKMLWERDAGITSKQATKPIIDPIQAKWASIRDIADSISNARVHLGHKAT